MIDGKNVFNQPVKHDLKTYDNIWKITTDQRGDSATGCLAEYLYFKEYYKMIETDLSKQQALDADPKVIQEISFTENLDQPENS